jgi:hypothetical protein
VPAWVLPKEHVGRLLPGDTVMKATLKVLAGALLLSAAVLPGGSDA